VDKDSLGGLLDFDKTRGFKRRMDAAKVKGSARIIATGKFWTIKNIFSVSPESKRWQQTLDKATVAKLYDDRKLLKVRNHFCIEFKLWCTRFFSLRGCALGDVRVRGSEARRGH